MSDHSKDKYAAREQGLGYIYQARLALLHLLKMPEDTALFLEKDDDLDFIDIRGIKSLASLKHKAIGDRLTDLSTDFWKSVNIWLERYNRDGRTTSSLRFFLLTTASVSSDSFLTHFLPDHSMIIGDVSPLSQLASEALSKSESPVIGTITQKFNDLQDTEKQDFLERISIMEESPRIEDIPAAIKDRLRTIRPKHREYVLERIEGWWNDIVIKQLTGTRTEAIRGFEVSEKLSTYAEEYTDDNLPITFRGKSPYEEIDTEADPRLFVKQLRDIGISSNRIRSAILDYYRAFQQRSEWARENLLVSGEIEEYEERLVDEWQRYKDIAFECIMDDSPEEELINAGKTLYKWAEFETAKIGSLRIRARVTESYVLRGSFQILADSTSQPRVHWHPKFLERLGQMLGAPK